MEKAQSKFLLKMKIHITRPVENDFQSLDEPFSFTSRRTKKVRLRMSHKGLRVFGPIFGGGFDILLLSQTV